MIELANSLINEDRLHELTLKPQLERLNLRQIVRVPMHVETDRVELHVADNGPGIPDSKKEWVFERFHVGAYLDSAESDAPISTSRGPGLSIVQDIAHAHGEKAAVRDIHPHGAMLVLILSL